MNLKEFLSARIAEDERAAITVGIDDDQTWSVFEQAALSGPRIFRVRTTTGSRQVAYLEATTPDQAEAVAATAALIAAHDPERVWREVEAKRRLLGFLQAQRGQKATGVASFAVRLMASVYADHPDYRPEWHPDYGG